MSVAETSARSSVAELIAEAAVAISRSRAIDTWHPSLSRSDAEELMSAVLGAGLTPARRRSIPMAAQRRRFALMVARRISGEPVARILGRFSFRGLDLIVGDGVFVPRTSSELLAGEAIRALRRRRPPRHAVDVATGAGPVALAMAHEVSGARVWGLDISAAAVQLGRRNARRLRLANVTFRVSDLLAALPAELREQVDVITIHPPYVARGDLRILPREIRDFEPLQSLTDNSDDGLGLVRRLAADAHVWLRPGGALLVEVGTYLSRSAQAALRRAGLTDVTWKRDSLGVTRVVVGRKPLRAQEGLSR
jgi:release factor glutamine methyltransferase